jgi:hypothetical protein
VDYFQDFVTRNAHHTAANWYRFGDTYSKIFFNFHKIEKKMTLLKELEIEGFTAFNIK